MRSSGDHWRILLFVLLLVITSAGCGDDATGEQVTITATESEDGPGGSFTATGGAICDSGLAANVNVEFTDSLFISDNSFTCADGSGSFILRGEVVVDPDAEEDPQRLEGTWTVLEGTGDYSDLTGDGVVVSTAQPPTTTYTGVLSN